MATSTHGCNYGPPHPGTPSLDPLKSGTGFTGRAASCKTQKMVRFDPILVADTTVTGAREGFSYSDAYHYSLLSGKACAVT